MKYLKTYESLNEKEMIIKELSSQVNFKLVSDIKDMSLEYLDEDLTLRLEIIYIEKGDYEKKHHVYSQDFSHDPDENCEFWHINQTINYIGDDVEFIYDVSLWVSNEEEEYVREDETDELVNRVKKAYPNEKIYSLYEIH